MPRFSSKHGDREKLFQLNNWKGGYTEEVNATVMGVDQLSKCCNFKYYIKESVVGEKVITAKTRQGTTKISNTALSGGADVESCYYYAADARPYILATSSKVYELDGSSDPSEIGSVDAVPTFTEFNGKLMIMDGGTLITWNGTTYADAAGAPKCKGGFVRGSRLYVWGDSDNPERLWYSDVNDETTWNYLDIDADDGYDLISCVNFYQSVVCLKENRIYRVDNFPGDASFRVEPLMDSFGAVSHRAVLGDGDVISFLTPFRWLAYTATEMYGDVQKELELSSNFATKCRLRSNSNAITGYNGYDNQLWLALYDEDSSAYENEVYVINLNGGGLMSKYRFAFLHSCFQWVAGKMLIGGRDGHLYELDNDSSINFKDNNVSYKTNTYIRTSFSDFNLPFNRKLAKKVNIRLDASNGLEAQFRLYRDRDYAYFDSEDIDIQGYDIYVADADMEVFDAKFYIYPSESSDSFAWRKRFNWMNLMFGLYDVYGGGGVELYGFDVQAAIKGYFGEV